MALPVNIDDLVNHRKVECARIEYKEGWNPERVLHTLCAFANDFDNWGGGYVILGVAEKNGKPVFPVKGLNPAEVDAIQRELLNICHYIEPLYLPVAEPCEYEGKQLLVIWVPGGAERPYKCPEHIVRNGKSPKAYYIRKLASTVRAMGADEKELFALAGDVPFDDRPNVHADMADLKMNLLVEFLHEVGSDLAKEAEEMSVADLARNMQIATGPSECFKPKNVGLMFFNPHPENFFRCAWIDVVDKPDSTGEGMVEKTFRGPLHVQLRSALDYIRNRFLREKIFKHDDRAEADRIWNYPYRAIEEALANAVYHKSYRIAEPITVVVTPTEMTISSLPGPERSISDEDLKRCRMIGLHYRNRRIGEFLKELDLVEGRNTGVPVIVRAMRSNGSPDPVFVSPETRDWLSVTLPIHSVFGAEPRKVALETGKVALETGKVALETGKVALETGKVAPNVTSAMSDEEELNEIQEAIKIGLARFECKKGAKVILRMAHIIQEMRRDPDVLLDEIAKLLKASSRSIDGDVALLRKTGLLSSEGIKKGLTWRTNLELRETLI